MPGVRPVVVLLACLLAAGCATTVSGPPAPTPTSAPPVRPREVRLDGVDPCSLLTPGQRAELGFTSEPHPSLPDVPLFRGPVPTCTIDGPTAILGVGLVTSVGIERWHEADLAAQTRSISVRGFPALVALPTRSTAFCGIEVDVGPGQLVDVQLVDSRHSPPLPQGQLCARAEDVAGEVIRTLAGP